MLTPRRLPQRVRRVLVGAGLLAAIAAGPTGLVPGAAAAGVTLTINIPSLLMAGNGFIASSDGRIGCTVTGGVKSGLCSYTYAGPTQVTLTATAQVPGSLVCFNGSCGENAVQDQIAFSQDLSYTGFTFRQIQRIYVGKLGPGAGTITSSPAGISCGSTCNALFDPGANLTLTAVAAAGSKFLSWDNESPCSTGGPVCTFSVADYSTIYAIFGLATPAPPTSSAPPATPAPTSSRAAPTVGPSGGPRPTPTPGSRRTTGPGESASASDEAPSPVVFGTDPNTYASPTPAPAASGDPGPTGSGGTSDAVILAVALVVAAGLVAIGLFFGLRRSSDIRSDRREPPAS